MSRNLEIKIKMPDLSELKKILSKRKIKLNKILYQKDIYYKVNRGILKLRIENGTKTLIYYSRKEKSKKRWSDYYLLNIDTRNAEKYFGRFLDTLVIVEKKRELFLYKNTRIHLDKVKKLGYFLELETMVVKSLNHAEERFIEMIDILNLKDKHELRTSYKDLLLKMRR